MVCKEFAVIFVTVWSNCGDVKRSQMQLKKSFLTARPAPKHRDTSANNGGGGQN